MKIIRIIILILIAVLTILIIIEQDSLNNEEATLTEIRESVVQLELGIDVNKKDIYSSINEDCIGWIEVGILDISYPIMLGEKYLSEDVYNNESISGTPFIDEGKELSDSTVIIYGHNMKNGTQFGKLSELSDKDYIKENYFITINSYSDTFTYKIVDFITISSRPEELEKIEEKYNFEMLILVTCSSSNEYRDIIIASKE